MLRKEILNELRQHAPFTVFGALTGVVAMLLFYNMPYGAGYRVFYTLHPIHIVLSALATTSMYRNYKCATDKSRCNIFAILAVGFAGSVGVATLSDSVIPYLGELLLRMPKAEPHIGFIEEWRIVLSLAILGIAVAYFRPATKIPHAGHVLVSTWASLFHIVMAMGGFLKPAAFAAVFVFLFFAVWVPCCISDIVFPLLFVGRE